MKTTNTIFALLLILFGFSAQAQELKVNTSESSIAWLAKKIGGQHEGFISLKSGSFEIKNDKIVSGSFIIDMHSITCTDISNEEYNGKLIGHLNSDDFFSVDKYPTAQFVVTSATKFNNGKAKITGKLTIKDKTEEISFDITQNGNAYTATIPVDRSKFDVRYGSNSFFDNLGDKAIEDIFTLNLNLKVN
ncbi:MAG: YceI family protein [Chitinophagales bacterium]